MSAPAAYDGDMTTEAVDITTTTTCITTTDTADVVAETVEAVVAVEAPPAPTTSGCKQPPPEKPSDIRRRSLIISTFWLIILCLGLPIWWHTTTIPRASLPLEDMMDWADGKVRRQSLIDHPHTPYTILFPFGFPLQGLQADILSFLFTV